MTTATKLSRADLLSLEQYSDSRPEFRARIIRHKANRRVALGPHATLVFEDRLTIQYQVQEMLRVERIFTASGIEEELEAYNPLIPDGSNWKATLLIEYPDADERRIALAKMQGLEHTLWAQVAEQDKIVAIANEDLERSNEEKTAAVHFLRFELDAAAITALKAGAALQLGIDHPELACQIKVPEPARDSLVEDLA